jgi:hypothetical protein
MTPLGKQQEDPCQINPVQKVFDGELDCRLVRLLAGVVWWPIQVLSSGEYHASEIYYSVGSRGSGDVQAKTDGLTAEAAPALTTKVAEKPKPVVKKKVVRVAHHRSFSGAYAQYNGWGWPVGGWGRGYRF